MENMPPYVVVEKHGHISGYMGEMWHILEDSLQLHSVVVKEEFRESQEMLKMGKGDVILQPTVITSEDVDSMDFTSAVGSIWYQMYVKAPEPQAYWNSYLTAWSPRLWMATAMTIVLLTAGLWVALNLEPRMQPEPTRGVVVKRRRQSYLHQRRYSTSLGSCFLSVLGSIGNAGLQAVPMSAAARVLVISILLFCMLMFNSYSAVLTSRLAVVGGSLPFSSLEEVANKGTHALCVRKMNYAYLQFKKTESSPELEPQWRQVVEKFPCAGIRTTEDIASVVCYDRVVLLETPPIMGNILSQRLTCRMAQIKGRYATAYMALQVRKKFPFTRLINSQIHRMHETGLLDYLNSHWVQQRPQQNDVQQDVQVSLSRVVVILVFYGSAVIISLIMLVVEIAYHRLGCTFL
ncbi:glutamate receptor 1-like [Anabrus simplex]|uniref:glutamate receptor 1-like n=1 Tax=Anabrus simplex TaxID=316456 RepID=UPI0035A34434